MTLEQSEKLLAGKKVSGADADDTCELLNYRDAFDLVTEYLDSGEAITEALIREIHKRLVKGVRGDKASPGQYRKGQNYVVNSKTKQVIYTPPPPAEVPAMMSDMVSWLRSEHGINPVIEAGVAQFQLVHIHPFDDGNGRTSRLLSTLCLYRKGYDFKRLFTISEYYDRDRTSFYKAIQGVREREMDLTGWIEYFTEGLATQMREVQDRGEKVIRRDLFVAKAAQGRAQGPPCGHPGLPGGPGQGYGSRVRKGSQEAPQNPTARLKAACREGICPGSELRPHGPDQILRTEAVTSCARLLCQAVPIYCANCASP